MLMMLEQVWFVFTLIIERNGADVQPILHLKHTKAKHSLLQMMLHSVRKTGRGSSDYKIVSKLKTHSILASLGLDLMQSTTSQVCVRSKACCLDCTLAIEVTLF